MTALRRPNRRRLPGVAALVHGALCPETRKVRYLDERSALIAREQVGRDDPSRARLGTWRCAQCGDWHVGHTPKGPTDAD